MGFISILNKTMLGEDVWFTVSKHRTKNPSPWKSSKMIRMALLMKEIHPKSSKYLVSKYLKPFLAEPQEMFGSSNTYSLGIWISSVLTSNTRHSYGKEKPFDKNSRQKDFQGKGSICLSQKHQNSDQFTPVGSVI